MLFDIAYDFEALISLSSFENGGRKKPIYDGYRPAFSFNSQRQFSGEIKLLSVEELKPGKDAEVTIKLLPSHYIRQNLREGHTFSILEGNKIVGSGIIKKIISKRQVKMAS